MMSRPHAKSIVILTLSIIVFTTMPHERMALGNPTDYQDLLNRQGTDGVVTSILSAHQGAGAVAELQQLVNVLAASGGHAVSVLDALAADGSVEAATISAELFYGLAQHIEGGRLIDDPHWRQCAEKASTLLDHNDPFVRDIATWAFAAVRDANRASPTNVASPGWLVRCRELKPESSLECDFVLQALSRDVYRTARDLSQSAQDMVNRVDALASYAMGNCTPQQRKRLQEARDTLEKTYGRQPDQQLSTDLTRERTWWLDVRRAVRDVVLAGPDMDFQEIVFFQSPVRTEGNHPDCLVQNHDRPKERPPGGDIFVKTGVGPSDGVRPLIAGQLGPGHVQDMDLWWDADNLVFAYVRQPRWGDEASAWGSVAWRNGPDTVVLNHVVGFRDGVFWENGSEPTHLFEIRTDGTGLRQLTDDPLYCDREPAYLPNGDVVFSSDRGCGASQCGAAPLAYSDFGLPNLFRVSASDGSKFND